MGVTKGETPETMAETVEDIQLCNGVDVSPTEVNADAAAERKRNMPIIEDCVEDEAEELASELPNEDRVMNEQLVEALATAVAVEGPGEQVVAGQESPATLVQQPAILYQTYGSIKTNEDRLTVLGHLLLAIILGNVSTGDKFVDNYLILAVCVFSLPVILDYALCSGAQRELSLLLCIPFALITRTMSSSLQLKDEFKAIFIFWAAFILLMPKMSTGMRLTCVCNLTAVLILTENYQWLFLPVLTAFAIIFYSVMLISRNNQQLENILNHISMIAQFLFLAMVAIYVVMPFDPRIFNILFPNQKANYARNNEDDGVFE